MHRRRLPVPAQRFCRAAPDPIKCALDQRQRVRAPIRMTGKAQARGFADRRWLPWAAAVLAALACLLVMQTIEGYQRVSVAEAQRARLVARLAEIRAQLETVINGNLLAIRGLSAVIAAQPEIDQAGFARVARGLFHQRHALRHIAGAPDMVVSLVYPLAGNEAALGLDYRSHPVQGEAARRAAEQRQAVIAGPLALVQGGVGLILREPVFVPAAEPAQPERFWGLISAVLDVDELYRQAGLSADGGFEGLRLALRGSDGRGAEGEVFYGDPAVFDAGPVMLPLSLPGGSWELAALAVDAAGAQGAALTPLRLTGLVLAVLLGGMALQLTRGRLALRESAASLQANLRRLSAAESIAHVGHWHYRISDGRIDWSDETYRIFGLQPQSRAVDYAWLREHLHPEDRERHDQTLQAMLETRPGDGFDEQSYRIRTEQGEEKRIRVSVQIEYSPAGKAAGLFGTVQDVTEAENLSRQLNQRLDELQLQKALLDRTGRLAQVGGWEFDVATMQANWTAVTGDILGLADPVDVNSSLRLFPGESRQRLERALASAVGQGIAYDLELELVSADGRHKWVRSIGLPVVQAGQVVRVEGAIQDITDRRQAENAAQRGRAILDSVFQALPDLFFLMDADGTIRDYRAQQSSALYLPPEGFLGKRIQDVMPPELVRLFLAKLDEAKRTGRLLTYEYDLDMPHGRRRFEARLSRLPDSDQLIAVIRDVDDAFRARRALQQSEARLNEAQRLAHIGSWEMDHADGRLRWSDEVYRIFEAAPQEFAPTYEAFLGFVHPNDRDAVKQVFERSVAQREPYQVVHRLLLPGERVKHVEERGETLYDERGTPLRSLGTVQDISARVEAEEQIRQLNQELEQRVRQRTQQLEAANRELETFTYSVSHDLKAPLRGIDGYSRLLIEDHLDTLNAEGRQFLHNVRAGAEQMGQLIDDLLAYSRMERRSLHDGEVDLHQLVGNLLAERRAEIEARGVLIGTELCCGVVRADPDGLAMVLRNLLDNALKFTRDRDPAQITIRTELRPGLVALAVRDNGIGFDMRFHDRIFEIFQRLQRAEDYPGTGIGLAIVRKAVQRMGGRVHAVSSPGDGAEFTVELPR